MQLRRSSASISANLAEGCGHASDAQLARYVEMSIGSAHESEHHLEFGGCVGAIHPELAQELIAELVEVRKMLYGLLRYLRTKLAAETVAPSPRAQSNRRTGKRSENH